MPEVEPLVLDFGLKNFYKEGLIECWVANEEKEGYCGKFLFVFDGQRCPSHHHRIKHETFFVVKGSVKMELNNKERLMKKRDIQVMPTRVNHSFIGQGNALLLEVSKPCILKDNIFKNKSIGENGII
jgi:N-acetylneuraminate synthase